MKEQTKLKLFQGPLKHIPDFEYSSNKNILKILYLCTVNYFTPIFSSLLLVFWKKKTYYFQNFSKEPFCMPPSPKNNIHMKIHCKYPWTSNVLQFLKDQYCINLIFAPRTPNPTYCVPLFTTLLVFPTRRSTLRCHQNRYTVKFSKALPQKHRNLPWRLNIK